MKELDFLMAELAALRDRSESPDWHLLDCTIAIFQAMQSCDADELPDAVVRALDAARGDYRAACGNSKPT
jgi:hypothetical protein